MYVRKRYMVQKSFRLDQDIERDLSILAGISGKSQNDLVGIAVAEMLQDNKDYFLKNAVYEHFMCKIESGEDLDPFEMGGLRVNVDSAPDGKVSVRYIWMVDGEVAEDIAKDFEGLCSREFDDYLKRLGDFISTKAEESKSYLSDRMDYRDFVKI